MLGEKAIAERLRESSHEFRELEEAHHAIDARIEGLQHRHVITPQEEQEKKHLQKEKLAKKDQMAQLIRQYQVQEADVKAQ